MSVLFAIRYCKFTYLQYLIANKTNLFCASHYNLHIVKKDLRVCKQLIEKISNEYPKNKINQTTSNFPKTFKLTSSNCYLGTRIAVFPASQRNKILFFKGITSKTSRNVFHRRATKWYEIYVFHERTFSNEKKRLSRRLL